MCITVVSLAYHRHHLQVRPCERVHRPGPAAAMMWVTAADLSERPATGRLAQRSHAAHPGRMPPTLRPLCRPCPLAREPPSPSPRGPSLHHTRSTARHMPYEGTTQNGRGVVLGLLGRPRWSCACWNPCCQCRSSGGGPRGPACSNLDIQLGAKTFGRLEGGGCWRGGRAGGVQRGGGGVPTGYEMGGGGRAGTSEQWGMQPLLLPSRGSP